jgi:hypothetical protein
MGIRPLAEGSRFHRDLPMGVTLPNKLTGTSRETAWHNRMRDVVQSIRLRPGFGYKLKETGDGTFLEIEQAGGGTTSKAGTKMFICTAVAGDYITAKAWDGTISGNVITLSGADVLVAKPPDQRMSLTREVVDGVTINYSWLNSNNRTANDGTNSEAQVCYKRYTTFTSGALATTLSPAAVIFAEESSNGTGVSVNAVGLTWIEKLPVRVWARRYIQ